MKVMLVGASISLLLAFLKAILCLFLIFNCFLSQSVALSRFVHHFLVEGWYSLWVFLILLEQPQVHFRPSSCSWRQSHIIPSMLYCICQASSSILSIFQQPTSLEVIKPYVDARLFFSLWEELSYKIVQTLSLFLWVIFRCLLASFKPSVIFHSTIIDPSSLY
jgi:hypothetical protein